jgi:hypothetical protein
MLTGRKKFGTKRQSAPIALKDGSGESQQTHFQI